MTQKFNSQKKFEYAHQMTCTKTFIASLGIIDNTRNNSVTNNPTIVGQWYIQIID